MTKTRRQTATLNFVARKLSCILLLSLALSIAASAQTFTSLVEFDQTNGANPYGTLSQGIDGNFYGTTEFGGPNGYGSVYKVTPDGALTTLYSFCAVPGCTDGGQPFAGLTLGFDQNFYGTTAGTVFRITTAGQLTTLYTFCSQPNCADGSAVYGTLVQDPGGDFYGTTSGGGIRTAQCEAGCGTIFKITPSGALTTIYSFHGKDGYGPFAGLTLATDGNLYGVASSGGAHDYGAVFKITGAGAFTLLHSFRLTDGGQPDARLLQASDGNFYGTTITGGGGNGDGTVFKITPSGTFTLLRSFNYANGASPYGGLIQASDGNFYGTTYTGGSGTSCPIGTCGTIFRITPTGRLTTLYNFCSQSGCADGGGPFAALTQASDGTFYGTTTLGGSTACGADGSCGTIFKLTLGLPGRRP
jgi:uncharacterized repeat protein (TIGR03803 family)